MGVMAGCGAEEEIKCRTGLALEYPNLLLSHFWQLTVLCVYAISMHNCLLSI